MSRESYVITKDNVITGFASDERTSPVYGILIEKNKKELSKYAQRRRDQLESRA